MDLATPAAILDRHSSWIAGACLLIFALAGAVSLRGDAATFDETAHLPAGLTYWQRGDFRMNPEHPPLSKAWAALPLWWSGRAAPDYASVYWMGRSTDDDPRHRTGADQWRFGFETLNGPLASRERRDPRRLLIPARMAMLVPAALLGWILFVWSREIWGPRGGLLSVFLYAISPTILAHARLVTTDLPAALGIVLSVGSFWRFTRRPGWKTAVVCGASTALALLVKFSALVLGPILLLLGLLWLLWGRGSGVDSVQRLRWLAICGLAVALASYLGLWAGYGFRFSASPDPRYALDWSIVGLKTGVLAEMIHGAVDRHVLPEAWLYGLAYFLGGAARRVAFLNGEASLIGWWYYFPEAFLIKTPPATLILLGWLTAWSVLRRRLFSFKTWFLLLPVILYCAVSLVGSLNIGHRHLAPIYPLLFVLLGGMTRVVTGSRRSTIALVLLLGLGVVSFGVATPRYLSYFNPLAGGAANGWRYLLDSNIDWGQDLARLKRWMDRHGMDEVHLAYFGTADPSAYGIRYKKVFLVHDFYPGREAQRPRSGDHVAVSVNLLQGLYFDEDEAIAERLVRSGRITPDSVYEWAALRDRLSLSGRQHPDLATWLVDRGIVSEAQIRQARSGLLSSWFRYLRDELEPVGRAGDSILIYRIP